MSDNEIYLLIKYIKSVLLRVAKCLSYIEEARCLKVNKIQQDATVLLDLIKMMHGTMNIKCYSVSYTALNLTIRFQSNMQVSIYILHASGVCSTHHQDYIKL